MAKSTRKHPTFADCMTMMRSRDPQVREDGFSFLRDQAQLHVVELVAAFNAECDMGLRCWLLELLALTRDPELTDLFITHLESADGSLRRWSELGLRELDTKEARTALFEATRRRG